MNEAMRSGWQLYTCRPILRVAKTIQSFVMPKKNLLAEGKESLLTAKWICPIHACFLENIPEKVIGDRAYDSDKLDKRLAEERGVEMIAPHRRNRCKATTQDGRTLRRYRKLLKVERLFAWLQNFRRLVVRYEYHLKNFLAMIQLGCIINLLRRVLG